MSENIRKNEKYIWRLFFACVLLLGIVFRVKGIEIPVSSSEEIPYWDLILRMAGKEGIVDLTQTNYMVSFGYCLPFSLCIGNGISLLNVYKAAVLVNGVCLSVLYLKTSAVAEKMIKPGYCDGKREVMVSLVCCLPIFISQASIIGPQMILALLTLIIIEQVVLLFAKDSFAINASIKMVIAGLIGVFLSPIFTGVVLGVFFYVILEKNNVQKNKKTWIQISCIFIGGILLFECVQYFGLLKMQTDYNIWAATGMQSLFKMIAGGRRASGFLGLIFGTAAKAMYLLANSFGFIVVGIYALFIRKKEVSLYGKISAAIFLNFLLMVVAINRTDTLCGLPMDSILSAVIPVILLEGVYFLVESNFKKKDVLRILAIIMTIGYLSRDVWEMKADYYVDWASLGITSLGRDFCQDVFEVSILVTAATAIIFLFFCIGSIYLNADREEWKRGLMKYYMGFFNLVMAFIVVIVFSMAGKWYISDVLEYSQKKIRFSYEIPGEYVTDTKRNIVYYYTAEEGNRMALTSLLSLNNKSIEYTKSLAVISELGEDDILITNASDIIPEEIELLYERIYSTDRIVVWEQKDSQGESDLEKSLIGKRVEYAKVKSSDYTFVEFGKGFVLPKGIYEIEVNVQIDTTRTGKLGRVAVRTGPETLVSETIKGTGKTETKMIKVKITSEEDMSNFRVAIHKERASDMTVKNVYVTKVGDNYEEK